MRNNQDRMGLETSDENLQPSHEPVMDNNQMEFIVPTEIVGLPTKGLFYEEGHPLHMKEEVDLIIIILIQTIFHQALFGEFLIWKEAK